MSSSFIFCANILATWYLVGLIWTIQVVHYNLFDRVGQQEFKQYEADHNRLITPIVGPPMLVEIATAGLLLTMAPAGLPRWAAVAGFVMVIVIWLSTAFIQVPCHTQLLEDFNEAAYRKLVLSNWIRTVLWTARGLLMGFFLLQMLRKIS